MSDPTEKRAAPLNKGKEVGLRTWKLLSLYETARGGASLCKSKLLIADAPSPHAPLGAPIGHDEPGPIDNKQGSARPGAGPQRARIGAGFPAPPLLRGANMAEGGTGR